MKSHFCFLIFTSNNKIPVGVGVGHKSALWFTVESTVESIVGSAVCSVVGCIFLEQTLRWLKCEDKYSKVSWVLNILSSSNKITVGVGVGNCFAVGAAVGWLNSCIHSWINSWICSWLCIWFISWKYWLRGYGYSNAKINIEKSLLFFNIYFKQ